MFYLSACTFCISHFARRIKINLPSQLIIFGFLFKILIGCLYGAYFLGNIDADTWNYHFEGLKYLKVLKTDPFGFMFSSDLGTKMFTIDNAARWIETARYIFLYKLSAVFSFFSGGNYYINIIFFNSIVYIGVLYLYKLMNKINVSYSLVFYLFIFFYPPFVFWTSGFHKDGLCFLFISLTFYNLYRYDNKKKIGFGITASFFVAGLLFLRAYIGVFIIIAYSLHLISSALDSLKPGLVYLIGLLLFGTLFFGTLNFSPQWQLPKIIAGFQQSFSSLEGNSKLQIGVIDGSPSSYLKSLPFAIRNTFFSPALNDFDKSIFYFAVGLDTWFVVALVFSAIYYRIISKKSPSNARVKLVYFGLTVIVINYIFIGIIVPFLGAIVRYKIIFELILILIAIQQIPLEKLKKVFGTKITIFISKIININRVEAEIDDKF